MRPYFAVLLVVFVLTGCAGLDVDSSDSPTPPPSASQYYDFDDVQVPSEMTLDLSRTFILETPDMKSGLLSFRGRVTRLSLTDYFVNNMPLDNWSMRSAIKATRSVLLFEKAYRYCIISITDGNFGTDCEIWILPKQSLDPFKTQNPAADISIADPIQTDAATYGSAMTPEPPVEVMPFPMKEEGLSN